MATKPRKLDRLLVPYRQLHAEIFQKPDSTVRSVLLTASSLREGCSTIAANLASYLSQVVDGRVLLIELDFERRPIKPMIDVAREKGVLQYLRGKCSREDILHEVSPTLTVAPSGAAPKTAVGVFSNRLLVESLKELMAEFDYVIVDGPTVGGVPQVSELVSLFGRRGLGDPGEFYSPARSPAEHPIPRVRRRKLPLAWC